MVAGGIFLKLRKILNGLKVLNYYTFNDYKLLKFPISYRRLIFKKFQIIMDPFQKNPEIFYNIVFSDYIFKLII